MVLIFPALALLYFSIGHIQDKFALYENSCRLERVTSYVEYAAALAKELQKERGLSIAALSGKNSSFFRKSLIKQRQETDRAYQRLDRFLWKEEGWRGEEAIKDFLRRYARIGEYRRKVDERGIPAMEVFDYYSQLVESLLETTRTLDANFINDTFARTIKNFRDLLYLIEISGRQRALISAMLEAGRSTPSIENQLLSLENEYESLFRRFQQNATVHTLQIFHRYLPTSLEKEYRSIRRQIIFAHRYDLVDSQKWWELSTRYINSLYKIDFALLRHLNDLKEAQKTEAIRTLWISVILWLLFLAFLYGLFLYILRIVEGFGQTIEKRGEETQLYKALAEFSEYLVFHRNEVILLNTLTTLLHQTGRFRYLWIGRFDGEEVVPLYSENISVASIEEELHSSKKEYERFKHALEQVRREKHPVHFQTSGIHSVLFERAEEVGIFPILRNRDSAYVLVVTLPTGESFDTTLLDLLQKMCNSLSGTLELIEVEAQEKRLEEELRIAATAFNAHEAITITDSDGTILQVNDAFTQITGYTAEEAIGNNPNILKSGKHDKEFYVQMWDSIRKEGFWKGEIYNRRKNGEVYPEMLSISAVKDQDGKITHYVAHFFDITEIKNAQHDAEYRAQHDALTELYNRQKLTDELERVYNRALQTREYNAFLYLDVDNFKHINDYYNHEMGDKVLIEVSHRLEKVVHGEDLLARIAGDEFALILCCLGTDRQMATKKITIVIEKIRNLFREPLKIDGVSFEISFSIGIKLFPDAEKEWKEVMINADVAMYHAKKSGKNRYNFFDENLDMESKRFLRLKNEFARALKENELVIHYQPRLDMDSGAVVGMEALVRWEHPERGLVYPDEFLFVAQGNTLGYELDDYVLKEVCRQIEEWRQRYPDFSLKVSVNLSGEQFNSRSHIEGTLAYLRKKREIARLIEFEIVEDALLKDIDHTIKVIRNFKELGVRFGMDDFGTGYSSIEYLKRLPVDTVKIDRSFILDLFENRNDEVVKLIVKTAEIFGMSTVAEGVENLQALEYLRSIGCTYYQGYYFSPPVPPEEVEEYFPE
jgi:diguanylate cyclase (GGDEF)-like protein/PAS domain S-box-containing protein